MYVLMVLYAVPSNITSYKKEFTNANGREWARRIIVDYMKKSDPDWLLASVLKVLDVVVKDNTSPGKQCRSYHAD